MNRFYTVTFLEKGRERSETTEASGPGEAFAKTQLIHPEAEMLRAERSGKYRDGEGYTLYDPLPIQRPPVKEPKAPRPPKKAPVGCELPFYDEVKSRKPKNL